MVSVKMENTHQQQELLIVNPVQKDAMEIALRRQENVVHAQLDMDIQVEHVQNVQLDSILH